MVLHVKCLSQVHVFEHLVPSGGAVLEAMEPGPCSWLMNSGGLWMLPSLSNHLSLNCIYLSEYASSVIHMWRLLLEFSLPASRKLILRSPALLYLLWVYLLNILGREHWC